MLCLSPHSNMGVTLLPLTQPVTSCEEEEEGRASSILPKFPQEQQGGDIHLYLGWLKGLICNHRITWPCSLIQNTTTQTHSLVLTKETEPAHRWWSG